MNANNPEKPIESVDFRALTDAELDDVSGGFLPLLVAALWAIDAGVLAGMAYCSIMGK
jgi:lactobin A/cerein 7B family class IIb bacteriocin